MNGKMKRFVWTLSVAVLCGIAFGADGDRPKLSVDCAFPGGNVKVCGIDDEAGMVSLDTDEPIRYLAQWDEPWMVDYNVPPEDPTLLQSRLWALTVSNVYLSSCWEIPFGRCGGVFTPEAARRFGRSMARTLVDELKPVTPSVPRTSSNAVSR